MDIAIQVLEIVAPVFLLGLVGFGWVKAGHEYRVDFVTRMCFSISVPALLFTALANAELDPDAFARLAGASLLAYLAAGLGLWILLRLAGLSSRTWLAPLTFGNTGNVGLPVAMFAFGDEGLAQAAVIFAVMACLSFTVGVWIVSGGGSPKEAAKQPIFYGAALGMIFALMDWTLPLFLMRSLELAGQMAIPLMLVTLGVSVARLTVKGVGPAIVLSVLRLAVCGVAGWGAAMALGVDLSGSHALILQMIMPVAVTSYLMAERYAAEPERVAGAVVVSTLVAVATIPLTLALMLPDAGM
ncbi:AEC family transporter [Albimonas sp. CAU 1670]|uniref:AEC family transporter n=1 Tax=Albimonas sp. CAU 1670 TaxID=3032599 RepID=UPI0023D9FC1A|nr:AEC family transporter [Albimonas sp. CAU 1670]MDF2232922.1 AEC family transporter [Albimonas sp. CAU 1670]